MAGGGALHPVVLPVAPASPQYCASSVAAPPSPAICSMMELSSVTSSPVLAWANGFGVPGFCVGVAVGSARGEECPRSVDESHSHSLAGVDPPGTIASAAAAVEDVETDPVLIIDGLTKNWRYPGWRVSWTVGPSVVIEQLASAGSFLDGGASHPLQAAAAELLDPQETTREAAAIQRCFRAKRDFMVSRLERMGIRVACPPAGAFYCWGDLRGLPEDERACFAFFEAGLEESVITLPGVFFDVNPGRRRPHSRYAHLARFSFGPDLESVERGMDALERVIAKQR